MLGVLHGVSSGRFDMCYSWPNVNSVRLEAYVFGTMYCGKHSLSFTLLHYIPYRRHLSLSSATRCVVYSWNGVLGINFFVHIFQQLISLTSSEIFRYFRDVATVGLGEGGGGVSGGFYFRICMFYHQLLAYYTSGYPRGYVGQYRGLVRNCRRYVRDSWGVCKKCEIFWKLTNL